MKFFDSHFTKKSLFRAPHKWFLALLVSPIHAAEMRYKKKYHLNYLHARKLFFFDMLLLFSTVILGAATIFWYTYDPTVTDLVHVEISSTIDGKKISDVRAESGDLVNFSISFENNSDVLLTSPSVALSLPAGFLLQETFPSDSFDSASKTFSVGDLPPKSSGEISFNGIFYGTPGAEEEVRGTLSYRQEFRDVREQTHAGILTILRGSKIQVDVTMPDTVLAQSKTEVQLKIENTGERPISGVVLPLTVDEHVRLEILSQDIGEKRGSDWFLGTLPPGESVNLEALLITSFPQDMSEKTISFAPTIQVGDSFFAQLPSQHRVHIVHPRLDMNTRWDTDVPAISPGDILDLQIELRNTSNATFEDVIVSIPLPAGIIDTARLARENSGYVRGGSFFITSDYHAALAEIRPDESTTITLHIPARSTIQGGAEPKMSILASISASIQGVQQGTYSNSASSEAIPIGGQISLSGESRYYTAEGDQLGRGPLPPVVGKETKYWALLSVRNSASILSNVSLSATLPSYIRWTGRSSVSRGNDVSYNAGNNRVSWRHSSLAPFETIGIYFELAFTPSDAQRGTHPLLLQNISVSGYDSLVNKDISNSIANLSTSIPTDAIGKEKGTLIQ